VGGKKFCRRGFAPLRPPCYGPADDQEGTNNFYQRNKLLQSHCLSTHGRRFSVKSGFTTLVNKRVLKIFSTPSVLHRHALASKALLEYLKTVLKHAIERVNVIRARACLFKLLFKDELIDLQC